MTAILVIPLAIFQHFSDEKATICTIVFAVGVGILSAVSGNVTAYAIGQALGSMILGGLYFGFLGRLDEQKWVYWTLLIAGGALLILATS